MIITHELLQDIALLALAAGAICSVATMWEILRRQREMQAEIVHLGKAVVWLMMDLEWRMAWVEKHPGVPVAKPPDHDWDAEGTRH